MKNKELDVIRLWLSSLHEINLSNIDNNKKQDLIDDKIDKIDDRLNRLEDAFSPIIANK